MAAGSTALLPRPKVSFQIQNSLNLQVEEISKSIKNAKRNKSHLSKYTSLIKQIIQALSGAEATFLRNAEFYPDLRETLSKIQVNVTELSKRKSFARFLMAKKDALTYEEMQKHVDTLCGRIFLSYAQRMEKRATNSNKSLDRF